MCEPSVSPAVNVQVQGQHSQDACVEGKGVGSRAPGETGT